MFKGYKVFHAEFPGRPDILRMIVMPLRIVYINTTAAADANLIRLVQDRSELVPLVAASRRES